MKDQDDLELLQKFAKTGSEELFSRLVHRYAPLVYSVGLRVAGSPEAARDATQNVFIDLLRKLPRVITFLERECSREAARAGLVGWLHRAARYEALELIRSESRRQTRERIAMELQDQSSLPGSEWSSVRPLLDEALDSLDESDRRAVLLRYFQDASYREVGATFGVGEDAAQKRVSRALDRLREILVRKGIATSAASLAAGLISGAIESAPPELANSVSAALREDSVLMARIASPIKESFLPRLTLPLAIAFTVLIAIFWLVSPPRSSSPASAQTVAVPVENPQQFSRSSNLVAETDLSSITPSTPLQATMGLRVVSADTGLPLNDVLGVVNGTMDGIRASGIDVFRTDADGYAGFAYTNDLFGMSIELSLGGFASTRLSWKPGRGQAIPPDYTLRMSTAPLIGGFVLDENGAPVSDVWIQFSLPEKLDGPIGRVESFYCHSNPKVLTDANGYFETKRIAREILPEIQIAPARNDFLSHGWLNVLSVTNGVEQLLSRSFPLVLQRGLEVRGRVVDQYDSPAPGVRVTFGSYYSNQRSSTSSLSGDFVLKGCTAGTNIVSAFDDGRGAGFQIINVSTNTEPCVLRLERFRTLHVQTVDSTGAPVPHVQVAWHSVDETGKTSNDVPGAPTPQYSFNGTTDSRGELIWSYAPADEVMVSFYPKNHGQRHNLLLRADASVQIVTLEENYPPQLIQGTVQDASTGTAIPAIRVRRGYPRTRNGLVTPVWYSSFRDVVDFAGGTYKFEFDYSVDDPPSRSEYIFEFSAEGYEPAISRVIRGDEGNLDLDVLLQPASNPTDR